MANGETRASGSWFNNLTVRQRWALGASAGILALTPALASCGAGPGEGRDSMPAVPAPKGTSASPRSAYNYPPASIVVEAALDCRRGHTPQRVLVRGGDDRIPNRSWSVEVAAQGRKYSEPLTFWGAVRYKYAPEDGRTTYAYGRGVLPTGGIRNYIPYARDTFMNRQDPIYIDDITFLQFHTTDHGNQLAIQCSSWYENQPTHVYDVIYPPAQ